MKILNLFFVAVTASLFMSNDAFALRVHKNQQERIKNGRANGQLSKAEVLELRQQGKAIKLKRDELERDGKLDVQDRLLLRKLRKERSQNIYKLKHNDETDTCAKAKKKAQSMRFAPGGLQEFLKANGC
jgi:hypothetical protein